MEVAVDVADLADEFDARELDLGAWREKLACGKPPGPTLGVPGTLKLDIPQLLLGTGGKDGWFTGWGEYCAPRLGYPAGVG